jgi:hypothetical protein
MSATQQIIERLRNATDMLLREMATAGEDVESIDASFIVTIKNRKVTVEAHSATVEADTRKIKKG